nr:immunoglobulin light chain junction region [Macaca mulatta]
CLRYSYSPLTF